MTKPIVFGLAVKAIIFDAQGRCLLLRRSASNRHFVGCWEWPGGKLERGEDFTTGAEREVAEEAGLKIEFTGWGGATDFTMPTVHVVLLCLEARPLGAEVRLSGEHDAFAWVPLAEVGGYELPAGVADFMRDYAKRKGTKP